MTRAEMIKAILDDMIQKNNGTKDARAVIFLKWKPWLNRQKKAELDQIMTNRKIQK